MGEVDAFWDAGCAGGVEEADYGFGEGARGRDDGPL